MKRQLFVRKGVSIVSMIGLLCVSLFTFCAKENPTTPEKQDPTYSFSGFIIDGNTGKALSGATVLYFKANGDSQTVKTGVDGGFDIPGIPYGNRSFFFKYISTGTDTTKYTTAAVTIEGNDWENFVYKGLGAGITTAADTVVGGIRNVAGPVKLYPLSGSLSGTVITQLHDRANLNPIKNAVVKVTFDPAANLDKQGNNDAVIGSNVEVGPSTFEVLTDSTGKFTITGLPVSGDDNEKVKIKVVSVTSGGIDWTMTGAVVNGMNVELASNQSVPVGAIILNPIVKIALSDLDNNFKTGVVNPEHTFEVTYSDDLDTVSYAVLSYTDNVGVKRNVPATVTVAAKKITVNPITSLINETAYTLNVYAYGKTGQSTTDNFNVTAAGGGLADVVASNVLTATKAPVFNFGVKTPITFTYADSITGNPSVQITNNDVLVTTSADGKTLTVTPRSIWKNGIINVNLVLKNGTAVRFSTDLNIENALSFVSSNVCDFNVNPAVAKNGLTLNSDIVFFTNKDLTTADVILKEGGAGGTTIPATVSLGEGDLKKVVIEPINTLKPATQYTVTITAGNAQGESKSQTISFTTTAAQFYSVSDNVRIGNDPTMPRLDFAPNANIVIRMNRKVVSATVVLSGVDVKTVVSNDSIIIDPEVILTEGTPYNLDVNAVDSFGQVVQGRFVTGLIPRALVIVMASNIISADGNAVTNASKDISPWFKLSIAPVAAKIKAVITNPAVDAVVSVNGDTLVVNPVSDFAYGATPTVTITGEAVDGNYISITKSFTVLKKPAVSLVASNVVNSNYEGLTGVAENIELWYKLSRTPSAATVNGTINANKAVVRISGDTVFLKATENLTNGQVIPVTFSGLDTTGISFTFTSTGGSAGTSVDWKAFTIREALFPVASNTWGVMGKGDPAKNFAFYDTMWVKFSQPLSTDLTTITWQNSLNIDGVVGNDVDVFVSADQKSNPNSVAWVNGDTLFVLPDNRANISWNKQVGFGVTVKTTQGQASGVNAFEVETSPLNLYVKATNTLRADGTIRSDVGFKDTLFVVSSVKIDSIKDVTVGTTAGYATAPPDLAAGLIRTAVWLSASKDTIFYAPKVAFVPSSKYSIDFDVYLSDDKNNLLSNKLEMAWEVKKGIEIYTANILANPTTYRSFAIVNDSLVVRFTKAVKYNSTSNPFTINGLGQSATTTWSADSTTVTIKPVTALTAQTWVNNLTYYTVDYATANNKGLKITFDGVTNDGEVFTTLDGKNKYVPEVRVVSEMGLALLSTNLLDSANNVSFDQPVIAGHDARDGTGTDSLLPIAESVSLTFSRAIDTAKVKQNPAAYIKLWEMVAGAANDVQNEVVLSYSNSGKTVVIDPVAALKYNTVYYVEIDSLPAMISGVHTVKYDAGVASAGGYDNNHVFTTGFKTITKPTANISALQVIDLGVDTVATTTGDKRYGYSSAGGYTGGAYKGPAALTVRFTELAWNANHADSILEYQVQVKTMGSKSTGWYTCATASNLGSQGYSTFNSALKNRNGLTINLGAQTFYNDLKTLEKLPNADYANGDAVFNYGDTIAVRIRPIIGDGMDAGEFGLWSNVIYYKDNTAPVDSTMCTAANYNVPGNGGVSITRAGASVVDGVQLGVRDGVSSGSAARGFAPDFTNGTLNATNSYSVMDVTFPEDMDITTTPSMTVFYGAGAVPTGASAISLNTTYSKWVSSRVYRIVYTIPAVNYTANDVYCVLNIAGMKDASGVTIQSHGSTGTAPTSAINGTGSAAVVGVKGTVNIFDADGAGALTVGLLW